MTTPRFRAPFLPVYSSNRVEQFLIALERWLEELEERDLLSKAHILVGIGPLRSVRVTRHILEHIPDIAVPSKVVELMEQSPDPEETGLEIALRLIEQVKQLPGVSGIHIMSVGWDSILPRLPREAGLINHVRAW